MYESQNSKYQSQIADFFKTLLLQILLDHSEPFSKEARHFVPVCNKARISKFYLKFMEFHDLSSSETLLFLQFLLIFLSEELDIYIYI